MCKQSTLPSDLEATLDTLTNSQMAQLDPIRYQYLFALLKKAESQQTSVARMLQKKAATTIEKYLKNGEKVQATSNALKSTETLQRSSVLSKLNQTLSASQHHAQSANDPSLDEQWQQQEQTVLQQASEREQLDIASNPIETATKNKLGAMYQLRESLHQGHTEKRLHQTIVEGPETPGPLNPESLLINTLSKMQDLSPSYTLRLVDYLDSLLWLKQANHNNQRKRKA